MLPFTVLIVSSTIVTGTGSLDPQEMELWTGNVLYIGRVFT